MLSTTCAATAAPTTCRRETSSTRESQWARAKGFDTFCPVGSECVPVSELGDGSGLRVVQRLNGEVLQDGNTTDLIFTVPFLVAYISSGVHARAGRPHPDRHAARASAGRATRSVALRPGDVVEVEVDGIGVLRNPVIAES